MSDAELTLIEQRAAAATPGPWSVCERSWGGEPGEVTALEIEGVVGLFLDDRDPARAAQQRANFTFLAAARADVPALAEEVRRLRAALEEITRLGQGHLIDSAVTVARAALNPAADR